jgi:hypothetical protein
LDLFSLSAAFAILVAFPLALSLDTDVPRWLRRLAVGCGLVASASFLVDRGPLSGLLAAAWSAAALGNFAHALLRFLSSARFREPWVWAEAMAGTGPIVGAIALIYARASGHFAGFGEPFITLTVTHFHFVFGLLPLTLSALARAEIAARLPLWGFVFAPLGIGICFATRPDVAVPTALEAAFTVALGLTVFAWSMSSPIMSKRVPSGALLVVRFAGLGLLVAVSLAVVYSVSLAGGFPRFEVRQMASTHGLFNATATTALGLVAWMFAPMAGISAGTPRADLQAATRDVDPSKAIFVDRREFDLGPAAGGRFERIGEELVAYRFYPAEVMRVGAAFIDEGRPARVGDRIGMHLQVPLFPGFLPAQFRATTEINQVEQGSGRYLFGYLTTTAHYGKGAWWGEVERRGDRVVLLLQSRMTPTHPLALMGLPLYRWFQKRAHAAGAARLAAVQ